MRVPIGAAIFARSKWSDEVSQRLCCGSARVNWLIETGDRTGPTIPRSGGRRTLATARFIDDDHDLTMTSFESKVARIEAMFAAMGVRLGLVLIDYFQLVDVRGEGDKTRTRNNGSTSRLWKTPEETSQTGFRKTRPTLCR